MTKKRKRLNIKSIIVSVVAIVVVVFSAGAIATFASNDKKTLSDFNFKVGGISETDGEYVERKDAVYTMEAIECKGLSVVPDYDCTVEYQIFWYNEDEIYFDHTEIMTKKFVGNVPECARYCRIMVIPSNLDDKGKPIKDFEVKFYNAHTYVDALTVKVDKDQAWQPLDYYEIAQEHTSPKDYIATSINDGYNYYEYTYYQNLDGTFLGGFCKYEENHVLIKLDCSLVSKFEFAFNEKEYDEHSIVVIFFNEDGKTEGVYEFSGSSGSSHIVDVLPEASYIAFNVAVGEKPIIVNKYLPR